MELNELLLEVCRIFGIEGDLTEVEVMRDGHINTTYVVFFNENGKIKKYLVQGINTHVFKKPDELMDNIVGVTTYLREKIQENGGDPDRETLTFLPAKDGKYFYYYDEKCWRIYHFIDSSYTINIIKNPSVFENAGKSFGLFQKNLSGYPMESLYEIIKDFHNTPKRLENLKASVAADVKGRAAAVKDDIDFALSREKDTKIVLKLYRDGLIPLRVTHNDTKLNNVLMDENTGLPVAVIDLDTVMPGSYLYDFGDAIRFGATRAAEDEKDLSIVNFEIELFEKFAQGYLEKCGSSLTETEIEMLPYASIMLTLECGMRFLGDYLNGDIYFKIHREGHNLDRARTQFKLVSDMEKNVDNMRAVINKILKK